MMEIPDHLIHYNDHIKKIIDHLITGGAERHAKQRTCSCIYIKEAQGKKQCPFPVTKIDERKQAKFSWMKRPSILDNISYVLGHNQTENTTRGHSLRASAGPGTLLEVYPSGYSDDIFLGIFRGLSDELVVLGISSEIHFLGIPSKISEGFPRKYEFPRDFRGNMNFRGWNFFAKIKLPPNGGTIFWFFSVVNDDQTTEM
ncbi:hypothetical protein YC2023_094568 [Brassica napus]